MHMAVNMSEKPLAAAIAAGAATAAAAAAEVTAPAATVCAHVRMHAHTAARATFVCLKRKINQVHAGDVGA